MKQHTIKTNKAEILIVDLPEGWKFVPGKTENRFEGPYTSTSVAGEHIGRQKVFYLPHGDWQLLGKLEDVSEDVADSIVEWFETEQYYKNYLHEGWISDISAKESFKSLIESEISLQNPHGEKPDILRDSENSWSLEQYQAWQAAEEKVFHNPIILLKK